ncbi:MAG: M64 family metallopeptidase [Rikenellaceae bacterium]
MNTKDIKFKLRSALVSCNCPSLANTIDEPIILLDNNIDCHNVIEHTSHFSINTTRSWRLSSPDWVSVTPKSGGAGTSTITIKVLSLLKPNENKRQGLIRISQDKDTKSVSFTQRQLTDREALLTIKSPIYSIFDSFHIKWGTQAPINKWEGVIMQDGDIIGLDLSKLTLNFFINTKTIASAIACFSRLKTLDLSNCNITGDINVLLNTLSAYNHMLETLILNDNPFEKASYITPEIHRLKKLKYISLNNCNIACKIPTIANRQSSDLSEDGKAYFLQKASCGKGINLVITGDGFTSEDMARGGIFPKIACKTMEAFFSVEPTKSFRNYFNVYMVKAISKDRGIGKDKDTVFSSYISKRSIIANDDRCMNYALKTPHIEGTLTVINIANTIENVGACASHKNGTIASCSAILDANRFRYTICHESVGHGLGLLDDEYSEHEGYIDKSTNTYSAVGANIDFTPDKWKVKWSKFLTLKGYKDKVGIFEGGLYYTKGVWRPSETSIMRSQDCFEFNAPSRYQIYCRIMTLAGKDYSFKEFLEYDKINLH